VLEVSQIARTIARALQLNEDLTEAIALAHDLGHAPFATLGSVAWMRCWEVATVTTSRVFGWSSTLSRTVLDSISVLK
jgi:GAF domain-containing protein